MGPGDRHLRRMQCPLPMEGAQPGQQPLPNPERQTWGPSWRLQERREHIPRSDASTEGRAPPKPVSGPVGQQAALRTRRRGDRKFPERKDPAARPEAAETQSLSYRHLPGEHSGVARREGLPGPQRRGGKRQWMESRRPGCLGALLRLTRPSLLGPRSLLTSPSHSGALLAPLPCFIRLHDTPSLGHKIAY